MDLGETSTRVDHVEEHWRRLRRVRLHQTVTPPGPLPATAVEERAGRAASG